MIAFAPDYEIERLSPDHQGNSPSPAFGHSGFVDLAAPQAVAGTVFPAGSTVHINQENGRPDFGTVPVTTRIAGLSLIGSQTA